MGLTQVNTPYLIPARQGRGIRLTYPGGMEGRVDLDDIGVASYGALGNLSPSLPTILFFWSLSRPNSDDRLLVVA